MKVEYKNMGEASVHTPDGFYVRKHDKFLADNDNPTIRVLERAGKLVRVSEGSPESKEPIVNPVRSDLKALTVAEAKLVIGEENEIRVLEGWAENDERVTIKKMIEDRVEDLEG